MDDVKNCKNCIWYDQCHEEEACEYYESVCSDVQEAEEVRGYEEDLQMRYEASTPLKLSEREVYEEYADTTSRLLRCFDNQKKITGGASE